MNAFIRSLTIVTTAAVCFALATRGVTAQDVPLSGPDATMLYERAVRTMQALPRPAFVEFSSLFSGDKTGFEVSRTKDGIAQFAISTGSSSQPALPTAYRQSDRLGAFTLPGGIAHTHSALADPTWLGAAAFARYGLHPPQAPQAAATPAASSSGDLPVISTVSVFAVGFYTITGAGAATCPNGSSGKALHLVAARDPNDHPLTDAVIESQTERVCRMTFNVHQPGAVSLAYVVQLNFWPVDAFYLATTGTIDGEIHVFGIGAKHVHVHLERSAFAFPSMLGDAAFGG